MQSSSILQIRWLDPLIPFLHYLTIEEQSRLLKCFFWFCSCKLCQHNAFAMKEQVNRAYKEESSDDEKREPLSEVSRFLSCHFVFFLFRKTKMARFLTESVSKRVNLENRWLSVLVSFLQCYEWAGGQQWWRVSRGDGGAARPLTFISVISLY